MWSQLTEIMFLVCCLICVIPSLLKYQSHSLKILFYHTTPTPDRALENHAFRHDLDKYAGELLMVFMNQLSVLVYLGTGQTISKL